MGITGVIYTSIARDGTLTGPDIKRTNNIAEKSGLTVILSAGVRSAADVEEVQTKRHPSVEGVIIGKAIYEKKLSLDDVIARFGS